MNTRRYGTILKYLAGAYQVFWYRTEIWISNTKLRRPYTYIFRDHPAWFGLLCVSLGLAAWLSDTWWARVPIIAIVGLLTGHVWWGSKIDRWQQENPEYNPIEGNHE